MELGVDPQLAVDLMGRMQAQHPMSSSAGATGSMAAIPSGGTPGLPPAPSTSQHGGEELEDPTPPPPNVPNKKPKVVKDKTKVGVSKPFSIDHV